VRWSLVLLAVLLVAGALGVVVSRHSSAPPPPPVASSRESTPAADAGLSDDEVFARSMALLADAKRRADEELAVARAADAGRSTAAPAVDAGAVTAALDPATAASNRSRLEWLAGLLRDDDLAGAWRRSTRCTGPGRLPQRQRLRC